MKSYVVGFCFDRHRESVILIEKQKPAWQKGKLNGVGGKIEAEDGSPMAAMIREFEEETGVFIEEGAKWSPTEKGYPNGWFHFATMKYPDAVIYCFKAFTNRTVFCKTQEAEQIVEMKVAEALAAPNLIPNLKILIPLAITDEFPFSEMEGV